MVLKTQTLDQSGDQKRSFIFQKSFVQFAFVWTCYSLLLVRSLPFTKPNIYETEYECPLPRRWCEEAMSKCCQRKINSSHLSFYWGKLKALTSVKYSNKFRNYGSVWVAHSLRISTSTTLCKENIGLSNISWEKENGKLHVCYEPGLTKTMEALQCWKQANW